MSKHRHSKDKMHITYTEIKEDWQGKIDKKKYAFAKLPFYCCALSLAPFQNAVCTSQGHVFDILYIMPFIKKYQRNPITGKPLKASELIKMVWTKNQKGQYEDPISYKVFTQYTHIVCIKTSGFVYAYDTVNQLNKKQKFYHDLVTNQPFTNSDIITIQDPKNLQSREVKDFDYLKNQLPFIPPEKLEAKIAQNQSLARIMDEVKAKRQVKSSIAEQQVQRKKKRKVELQSRQDVKGFIQWCIENKIYKHQRQTDYVSASLTSTNFTPTNVAMTKHRQLKQSEIREKIYKQVKKNKAKGFVQIMTNLGNINTMIHCDLVPHTAQNFIQLAQSGYYDNIKFHRLVKDFCLQGGDPTETGSGGQSIYGKSFSDQFHQKLTHDKPGVLSMCNSGPNTNRSQFFITLGSASHLNNKHSVFGQVISNQQLLVHINRNLTSKSQTPKQPIIIIKMFCYDNPFRKAIKKLKQTYEKQGNIDSQQNGKKAKQRWIAEDDNKLNIQIKTEKEKAINKNMKKKEGLSNKLLQDYY